MPTTPVYALRYPASSDPADVPTDMGELATDVESKLLLGGVTYSTTPPATPVDGQLWAYPADTTNGIIWMFRYRTASSSSFKWEYVGGPDLYAYIPTGEGTATTGSFVELATVGPRVVIPRAGDYQAAAGSGGFHSAANASLSIGITKNATAPANSYEASWVAPSAGFSGNAGLTAIYTGLTTSDDLRVRYRNNTAGTANYNTRWISVRPIRVS